MYACAIADILQEFAGERDTRHWIQGWGVLCMGSYVYGSGMVVGTKLRDCPKPLDITAASPCRSGRQQDCVVWVTLGEQPRTAAERRCTPAHADQQSRAES
jgi:hypothetical protein